MPAQALDRSRTTPLWEQLLTDLRRRLDHDEFAVAFPGELALVAQYGVSRHTVREAVRRLREEGLVIAGRGRTPRRAEPTPIEQPLGELYSLFTAVEATGRVQRSVVRALDVRADGVVAARLGLEESTPLVYLERLRLAGGAPLALDRVWLPASIGEPLLSADFRRTGLYDQLAATGIRITGGEETVRAVVPSRAEHAVLGLTPPAAAFSVFCTGTSSGVPVEWRHTLVRADRFALSGTLAAPGSGGHATTGDVAPVALTPDIR